LQPFQLPAIIACMRALIKSMRPMQWAKNAFVFAALIFDRQMLSFTPLLRTVAGFILLCMASSAVYLVNDIADAEADRNHPQKRNRPIASGALPVGVAATMAGILFAISLGAGFALNWKFGLVVLTYQILNILYSLHLKHVPIIDVMIVAAGFVLRVAGGVALIIVERFSPWLYVCTTLLALFIALGKRRAELTLLQKEANSHRRVLDGYSISFLDQLIVIVSGTTIVAYSLYTFSGDNLPANYMMMITIPFVVYGIFRYLHLIHVEDAGGAPEELVFSDLPLLITIVLWALTAAVLLYFWP
jgi:4-hydroxybenzoate polyprenyltransferase